MHIEWRDPDPSPPFSPASPLRLINNSNLTHGCAGRVRQGRQLRALNRRSGLNRASGMALIRYFLVPPKQTPPHGNCSHYPSPRNRYRRLWHICTITPAVYALNRFPGVPALTVVPSLCVKHTQIHTCISWPQSVSNNQAPCSSYFGLPLISQCLCSSLSCHTSPLWPPGWPLMSWSLLLPPLSHSP